LSVETKISGQIKGRGTAEKGRSTADFRRRERGGSCRERNAVGINQILHKILIGKGVFLILKMYGIFGGDLIKYQ
jgi:hypothetical protein